MRGLRDGSLKQLARGQKMLRGENLRGRHERGLVAVFHGDEHGLERDDRFARAHIALQQAAHGAGLAHVADDFAERPLLRGRGMEGKHLANGLAHLVVGGEGDAVALFHAAALEFETEFEEEELLEDQAAMSRGGEALQLRERRAFKRISGLRAARFRGWGGRDDRASTAAGTRARCRACFRAD